MNSQKPHCFAFFITPHGYGHAARAAAVMGALRRTFPKATFEIFTRVPRWFFETTIGPVFNYHNLYSDVGLVQDSVMDENLPETVRRLNDLLTFSDAQIQPLVDQVRAARCEMIFCDVAALGIAVAKAAGIPSLLEENFTWDWIYEGYASEEPGLLPHIATLRTWFAAADYHIRTEPACAYDTPAHLTTGVVGRPSRIPAVQTRAELGIAPTDRLVLLTMGGIGSTYPFLEKLEAVSGVTFLIPGSSETPQRIGNCLTLAHHSEFYHPDLVEASDLVVGKLGYSTLAETYLAGIPFAYIPRPRFRESEVMSQFVDLHMHGTAITEARFFAADWLDLLPRLLDIPRQRPT